MNNPFLFFHLNRIFPDLTAVDDKDQESENEEEEPEDYLKIIFKT